MKLYDDIGYVPDWIREKRKIKGYTQEYMNNMLTTKSIGACERGEMIPKITDFELVADELGYVVAITKWENYEIEPIPRARYIGSWIKKKRKKQKLTLQDLVDRTGLVMDTIWRYEKGKAIPNVDCFRLICEAFGYKLQVSKRIF